MGVGRINAVDFVSDVYTNIEKQTNTDKTNNINGERKVNDDNKLFSKQNNKNELDEDTLLSIIEQANKTFEARYTRLEFSIHKQTHEIVVKVYDKETNELIREIPPEKILDIIAKLWELTGIFVDERK